ncbi:ubiquinone/menaquinone biosynthesis methyltransferase [candidate division KSB1 bacterium]|nr:ubiquinone/menaquinone biosynthesis methyltransferase [candidate division KSB1 bacterium]MBL7095265.1 ubiquinone/menaquinone biosynthesis methyltransferase [candidate division KSB1 bacterium]
MPKLKRLQDRYNTAEEKETYIENMFSSIDENYDFLNRVMSLGLDMGWRRRAIKAGKFSNQSAILDVATGTGDLLLSAQKAIPGVNIVGLDFCRPFLLKAKEKLDDKNGRHPVSFIEANGLKLPVKDETFDGVLTAFSLRNVASVDSLFSEFYRITKPGGKVVSLEMMKPNNSFQKLVFSIHFKRVVPALGNLLAKQAEAYNYLPLSIENFYTANELTTIISREGWRNVSYKNVMFGFVAIHVGEK